MTFVSIIVFYTAESCSQLAANDLLQFTRPLSIAPYRIVSYRILSCHMLSNIFYTIMTPGARCNARPVATGLVICVCDWLRDETGLVFLRPVLDLQRDPGLLSSLLTILVHFCLLAEIRAVDYVLGCVCVSVRNQLL